MGWNSIKNKKWFDELLQLNLDKPFKEWLNISIQICEEGYSCIDLIQWIKQTELLTDIQRSKIVMHFHKIKSEYRNEKLLLFSIFSFIKNNV